MTIDTQTVPHSRSFHIAVEAIYGAIIRDAARTVGKFLRPSEYIITKEPTNSKEGILAQQLLRTNVGEDTQEFMFVPDRRRRLEIVGGQLQIACFADRFGHYYKFILPELARGVDVVSCRFSGSALPYSSALGQNPETIENLHRMYNIPEPDLTLFVDVAPDTAIRAKMEKRRLIPKLFDDEAIQSDAYRVYRGLLKSKKNWREVKPNEMQGNIRAILKDFFGRYNMLSEYPLLESAPRAQAA